MTTTVTEASGVLFDLDDTLFDCTGLLTGPARKRAAEILATSSGLSVEQLVARQVLLAESKGSRGAIEEIASSCRLDDVIRDSALSAYDRDVVEPIHPFPGVLDLLERLRASGIAAGCVTTGRPDRQRRKIDQLGLAAAFSEDSGTLVLHDPAREGLDKSPSLKRAAQNLSLEPHRTVVVGDKLDAEICAGNRLGMVTVHLRHGRQKDRTPRTETERPDHTIDRIADLLSLLERTA